MSELNLKVSIVIPVFNAEHSISKLVKLLISEILPSYALEIILVNDYSKDNSHSECLKLYKEHEGRVKYISLAKNFGEHNAVMAGLNKTTGDFVVIMDDDFQNPVEEVIKLIEFSDHSEFDVVYTYYDQKKHGAWRNLGSRLNNYMARVLLKKPKGLYLSSFKCLNRFLVNEIIKYDLPYPYIDGLILRSTANIGTLQVKHSERKEGHSGYTLMKLIKLWSNMFTSFSVIPLRISIFVGLFFAFTGFLFGIYSVVEHFMVPNLPAGFSLTITAIFMFAGIQLISLGMIGEYIGRIFISQNKQPQYTVKKEYL
jgi:glycosyltransferase involved in cell wall biosynthesis